MAKKIITIYSARGFENIINPLSKEIDVPRRYIIELSERKRLLKLTPKQEKRLKEVAKYHNVRIL